MTYERILRQLLDAGLTYAEADDIAIDLSLTKMDEQIKWLRGLRARKSKAEPQIFRGTKSIDWHLDINEWNKAAP